MLKKAEVEAIEHFEIDDQGELVAYDDFLAVKKTFEEAVKIIKYYAKDDINGHKAGRFLSKYEGD